MSAVQGSEAWLAERAGHATASRFCDVLATVKTGEAADRRKYRIQLVTERLTGVASTSYENDAMRWGKALEAEAREAYEAHSGEVVKQVGFLKHPKVEWTGASPDGLIGSAGGLEIKCPYESSVHVLTLQGGIMPTEHRAQVQGNMWVTGRQWWDFVSYDPRMPPKLRLFVQRVKRDEVYIATLAEAVGKFLGEVDKQLRALMEMAA